MASPIDRVEEAGEAVVKGIECVGFCLARRERRLSNRPSESRLALAQIEMAPGAGAKSRLAPRVKQSRIKATRQQSQLFGVARPYLIGAPYRPPSLRS